MAGRAEPMEKRQRRFLFSPFPRLCPIQMGYCIYVIAFLFPRDIYRSPQEHT